MKIFKFWEMATYEQAIYFIFVKILLNYLSTYKGALNYRVGVGSL